MVKTSGYCEHRVAACDRQTDRLCLKSRSSPKCDKNKCFRLYLGNYRICAYNYNGTYTNRKSHGLSIGRPTGFDDFESPWTTVAAPSNCMHYACSNKLSRPTVGQWTHYDSLTPMFFVRQFQSCILVAPGFYVFLSNVAIRVHCRACAESTISLLLAGSHIWIIVIIILCVYF